MTDNKEEDINLKTAPPHSFTSRLMQDIDGIIARDPAARGRLEVIFLYPSFHALLFYRLSHSLYRIKLYFIARFVSQFARFITGIEIHPGAQIGKGFFIDHGLAVVIGETAIIGNNVTLYQGVTLGGVSPAEDSQSQRQQKRHPTIEDEVIIGSGAQVLGPITVKKGARIGANAVVVRDVAEGATMVGIPAHPLSAKSEKTADCDDLSNLKRKPFEAYGMKFNMDMDCGPEKEKLESLEKRLEELEASLMKSKKPRSTKATKTASKEAD